MKFLWDLADQFEKCLVISGNIPRNINIQTLQKGRLTLNLTYWGRVMHICIGKLTIIGSDNGLSPGWCQAIIWSNAGILLIRTLGTNFSDFLSQNRAFSFKKMHWQMSRKRRPSCLGLNVLTVPVDGLTPVGARTCADTMFSSHLFTGPAIERLRYAILFCMLVNIAFVIYVWLY